MRIFLTVAGLLLVLLALWDVFQTLFHPAGRGTLSDWVADLVWRGARRFPSERLLTTAGPLAFVAVVAVWLALVILGFSLVYWPQMARIAFAPGLDPAKHKTYFDALNLSMGALITIGGDMNPDARWVRFMTECEAVIGFALLTASVSSLISIYRALERRHSLALQLTLLHHCESTTGVRTVDLPEPIAFDTLMGFAGEMTSVRTDLEQFPITYYFRAQDDHSALPGILPFLARLAEDAARPGRPPALRIAGTSLGGALDEYLKQLYHHYLDVPRFDRAQILQAYCDDHRRALVDLSPADHQHHRAA